MSSQAGRFFGHRKPQRRTARTEVVWQRRDQALQGCGCARQQEPPRMQGMAGVAPTGNPRMQSLTEQGVPEVSKVEARLVGSSGVQAHQAQKRSKVQNQ